MKIAVIGAMEEEIVFLKSKLNQKTEIKIFPYEFYLGSLASHEIILVESGIGKVASGGLFATLISNFKDIDLVINVGVSGGVINKTKTADVVIATKFAYHDADVRAFGYEYGQMAKNPRFFMSDQSVISLIDNNNYKKGTILSGDVFVTNDFPIYDIINKYFKEDNVLAIDMESTAFAQMAYLYEKSYLAIRVISDVVGEDKTLQVEGYNSNLEYATKISNEVLLEVLEKIKK